MSHRAPRPEDERAHALDPHRHASTRLSQLILGGQDGLVNVLGVLLGVAAATPNRRLVLVAGLATALSEALSMAAVAYTTARAAQDVFRSEQAREHRHLRSAPSVEREEVRAIYAKRGLDGDLLEQVVDAITRNADVWVEVMMREEHGLLPSESRDARRAAWMVGAASLFGALIPILPFCFLAGAGGMMAAALLDGAALFGLGWYKGKLTLGLPMRHGLEIAAIGLLSALAGWAVGWALGAAP